MAINHTPPSRNIPAGNRIIGAMNQLEAGYNTVLAEIRTLIETVDGGEDNAQDLTKMGAVNVEYGFSTTGAVTSESAVAAIGQYQAVRAVLLNGSAALEQAFARLRG